MPTLTVRAVEGSTEKFNFTLLDDSVPAVLTGKTVTLQLIGADHVLIDTSGDVVIEDGSAGKVSYTPDAADLKAVLSPYRGRFVVTFAGVVTYYPSGPSTTSPFLMDIQPIV